MVRAVDQHPDVVLGLHLRKICILGLRCKKTNMQESLSEGIQGAWKIVCLCCTDNVVFFECSESDIGSLHRSASRFSDLVLASPKGLGFLLITVSYFGILTQRAETSDTLVKITQQLFLKALPSFLKHIALEN